MTLLDDLQALDLSAIVDAKADISVTVNGDDLLALVGDGAVTRVLGDLGTTIDAAVGAVEQPEQLLEPLLQLFGELVDQLDVDLPVGDYVDAIAAAARIVADLIAMISGEPAQIGFGATTIGEALDLVGGSFGDHATAVSGGLSRFRALVQTVDEGLPSDPVELLGPALEILLPIPTGPVDAVRGWTTEIAGRLDELAIDPALTSGLVNALDDVRVAAAAGDAVGLELALGALASVRANTIDQLAAALRRAAGIIGSIQFDGGVGTVLELRGSLAGADESAFDLLDGWRDMIAGVRATVDGIDVAEAMAAFDALLDDVETHARDLISTGIDESVEAVSQWLRDLLREIPIRPLRLRLSQAIADATGAIAAADLDAPVATIRGLLDDLTSVLDEADPAALVQAAVDELEGVIRGALDALEDALGRVTAAIDDVAAHAQEVLGRAVDGLRDFRAVVDEITDAIENAGIVDAANEIAATLDELQEDVSELLSAAPLPDALRSTVDQLISTLESIDLDAAIGDPLREVAAQLQIPDDVATTVNDGLQAVADAIASLVPADVIADLEAMMGDLLSEIEQLDISSLTSGITDVIDHAAEVFEQISVTEMVAPASEAFGEIVAVLDRLHPRVLLRPAIDLYGQLLGAVPVPDAETIATRAGSVTSQAGESVARAAAEPARRAVGEGAEMPPAGEAPRGGLGPVREEPPDDLRPGDVVRLVAFLPAKLREALAALDAGQSATMLASISDQVGATAAALRSVRDRVISLDAVLDGALDAALAPVSAAQIDAQLAVRVTAAPGVDVDASMSLIASVGPGALGADLTGERQLIAERCRTARASLSGAVAHDLDLAADLLDAVIPAGVLDDVDALLAALDPEPIAAEIDALFADIVDATPAFLAAAEAEIGDLEARIRALIAEFNPGALMQRFLAVLEVVRDELAVVDPGRLADELGEIHAEVKAAVLAYDPVVLAGELDATIAQVAAAVRGLDPAGLMPDLGPIETQVARVGDILPVNALAGVGDDLTAVGDELRALDVQGMLDAVNALTPEVAEAITILVDAVRDEIVDLLQSIRYTSTSGSASVSVEVG